MCVYVCVIVHPENDPENMVVDDGSKRIKYHFVKPSIWGWLGHLHCYTNFITRCCCTRSEDAHVPFKSSLPRAGAVKTKHQQHQQHRRKLPGFEVPHLGALKINLTPEVPESRESILTTFRIQ